MRINIDEVKDSRYAAAMGKALVIVESPTKARTIRKFLPKDYIVEASMGHLRDLPQSAADIPAAVKKEPWANLGVNVDKDFEPLYVVPKGKKKVVRELKQKLKEAEILYLATDEDREGESISWHLVELLKPKVPVKRMVFHEITKTAIQKALQECKEVDMQLVKAQETRRVLDRIYGYTLSPLLWKKIAYGLSAGRVQSTGLRMIVTRERERMKFISSEYWDLKADFSSSPAFHARLNTYQGKNIAKGKDFDGTTGKLKGNAVLVDKKTAETLAQKLQKEAWKVLSIKEKKFQSHPASPFITSTLQQEGNRKLGMSARQVMRAAQKLYEEGLITYMRTDSPNLSSQAIEAARDEVESLYGKDYLSEKPRQYKSKSKGAQEAHEAIRPAGAQFVHPRDIKLDGKEKALYELIWKRTLATQMAQAQKSSQTITITAAECEFQAYGTKIIFPGFLRVYVEGKDDPDAQLEDKEVILPALKEGDTLNLKELQALEHHTRPPARFSEAALVQNLEKEGIGRPSTYASIIGTIIDRGYVKKVSNRLIPTFTGIAVMQILEKNFTHLVDYQFTSQMENSLDDIAEGKLDNIHYLQNFYLGKKGLKEQVNQKEKDIDPKVSRSVDLPHLDLSTEVKVGRYGPYIVLRKEGREEIHASIPEDIHPADLEKKDIDLLIEQQKDGPKPIGQHPDNGENIYCLIGRYGPYLQQGEKTEENPKPRRGSLPKHLSPSTVTIEDAVRILSLPRELGVHPETQKVVSVNVGRFGPYIAHDGEFRSLKKEDDVYTVELERVLEVLAQPKNPRRGAKIKDLGTHPKEKKKLALYNGPYGFFIKMGTKNIALPQEYKESEEKSKALTLEEVLKIIN